MKLWLQTTSRRLALSALAIAMICNATSAYAANSYLVECDDALKLLATGQLEQHVLSTERPEAELIQILKDNYVLYNAIFFKAFSIEILPLITGNQKFEALMDTPKKILEKVVKFLNKKDAITDEHINKVLSRMEEIATEDLEASRTAHLIVRRTVEAIQKSKPNRSKIYDIYKKAFYQTTLAVAITLGPKALDLYKPHDIKRINILETLQITGILSLGGQVISLLIASGLYYGLDVSFILGYGTTGSLLQAYIFSLLGRYLYPTLTLNPKKAIRTLTNLKNSSADSALTMDFGAFSTFVSMVVDPITTKGLSLRGLPNNPDIIKMSLTQAAYIGDTDIFKLNERYQTLNKFFQTTQEGFMQIRTNAQAVLADPESYDHRMELSLSVRKTVALLKDNLAGQKKELQELLHSLRNLKDALERLKSAPYTQSNAMEREDFLKGKIIVERFKKELSQLEAQALQTALIQEKLDQTEKFNAQLTNIAVNFPTSNLGWEEVAKKILEEVDKTFAEINP